MSAKTTLVHGDCRHKQSYPGAMFCTMAVLISSSARAYLVTAAGAARRHVLPRNFVFYCCFCRSFEGNVRNSNGPSWFSHSLSSQGALSDPVFVLYEMHSLRHGKANFCFACAAEKPWAKCTWFLFLLRCSTPQFHNWLYTCWRFTDCLCGSKYHRQFAVTTPKKFPPGRWSQPSCYQLCC